MRKHASNAGARLPRLKHASNVGGAGPSCLAWTYLCQKACFQCRCPGSHPLPGWGAYSASRKHVKSSWLDIILAWDPQNSSPDIPPIVNFGGLDACLHWWRLWLWMRVPKRRHPCVSHCGHQWPQEPSCLAWTCGWRPACVVSIRYWVGGNILSSTDMCQNDFFLV